MFKEIHLAAIDAARIFGEDYHLSWIFFYPLWFVAILVTFKKDKGDV